MSEKEGRGKRRMKCGVRRFAYEKEKKSGKKTSSLKYKCKIPEREKEGKKMLGFKETWRNGRLREHILSFKYTFM